MAAILEGGCLCGAVRYRSAEPPQFAGHCYCTDCRKSSGSARCTHVVLPASGFSVEGEVRFYESAADSGNIVSRGFCPVCGSALFSKNSAMPGAIFARASSLDDAELVQPQLVVYASRAPSWDAPAEGLPSFAEMPPGGAQLP